MEFLSVVRGGVIAVVMVVVVIVITIIVLLKYTTENVNCLSITNPAHIPLFKGKIDSKCNFSVTSALGFKSSSEIFINPSGVCTFFHSSLVKTRVLCALSTFASYT